MSYTVRGDDRPHGPSLSLPATLNLFVVYENPTDYPEQFVVRRYVIDHQGMHPDAEPIYVGGSLALARAECGMRGAGSLIHRDPADDPVIVESWL